MNKELKEVLRDQLYDDAQRHNDTTRRDGVTLTATHNGVSVAFNTSRECYTLAGSEAYIEQTDLDSLIVEDLDAPDAWKQINAAYIERWWVSDDKQNSVLAGLDGDSDEQCWRELEQGYGRTRDEMGGTLVYEALLLPR